MVRLAVALLAAIVVFSGVKPSAAADTAKIAFAPVTMDSWIVTVKGNVFASPKWNGSKDVVPVFYPSASIRRNGEKPKWSSPDDGIGMDAYQNGNFSAGPVARLFGGRYWTGNQELRGIHKVPWTVEGGAFATYWVTPEVRLRGELRRGFREKDGFQASFGADVVQSFRSWTVAIGPRLTLADGSYMRTHFGVTNLDAARNIKVTPYRATSGVKSAGLYASATYQFNDAWAATLHGGYDRLVGSAAKSPITRNLGTPNQYMIGLSIAYTFPVKGW